MSSVAARSPDWLAGLAVGCDRLVHPLIVDASQRSYQARLAGLLLVWPFLAAGAVSQLMMPFLGVAGVLALICAILAGGWLAVVLVASTGRTGVAGIVYGGAVLLTTGLVAAAGGLQSPFALMAVALAFEPIWLRRDMKLLPLGLAAVAFALFGQGLVAWGAGLGEIAATGWHWLVPAIYAATVVVRSKLVLDEVRAAPRERTDMPVEELFDIAVLGLADNGDVADVRGAVRRLFGLPEQMLLSTGLFERIHVADRVAYLSAVADMREGAESRKLDILLRAPRGNGEAPGVYRPFAVEMARSGKAEAPIAALFRDGSDLGDVRGRLSASQDQAGGGDIARNRFIASVSHELRTPLNAILGFSDMLLGDMAGPFSDPRQRDYVGLIRESGSHLLAVVNAILDVSKIDSGAYEIRPEPFRLAEAVATSCSMLSFQAEAKAVTLVTSVAPGTGEVHADRRAVKQMLINLLANAVKFTPEGGKVTVGARRLGSRVLFWVSDTGIGIAEDDLEKLGKPFSQVQNDYTRQFEGTGLGLAVVKGLVALHKGTMTIESAEGEGTVVTISLPVDGPSGPAEHDPNLRMFKEATHGTLRKIA